MEINEALSLLRRKGYCLWTGAGVTKYLSSAGDQQTPTWGELVTIFERSAGSIANPNASYPERLDLVRNAVGRENFQQTLFDSLYKILAESTVHFAEIHSRTFEIPAAARQIARLGIRANQIINFNIETFTSRLLGSSDPFTIKIFEPPVDSATDINVQIESISGDQHQRSIYHPHGAIDAHGLCVLTKTDYDSMNRTLAFQLAVHASFRENLMIVGMSMEDEYLRNQITLFRPQINKIIWFICNDPPSNLISWLEGNRITLVQSPNWNDFWISIDQNFPMIPDEILLLQQWWQIVSIAFHVSIGFSPTNAIMESLCRVGLEDSEDSVWRRLRQNRGERPDAQFTLSDGDASRLHDITEGFNRRMAQLISDRQRS